RNSDWASKHRYVFPTSLPPGSMGRRKALEDATNFSNNSFVKIGIRFTLARSSKKEGAPCGAPDGKGKTGRILFGLAWPGLGLLGRAWTGDREEFGFGLNKAAFVCVSVKRLKRPKRQWGGLVKKLATIGFWRHAGLGLAPRRLGSA